MIASITFFDINPIIIGVDINYSFVMRCGKNNILPITEETAVNLLRLLEIEYHVFCQKIEKIVDDLKTTKREVQLTSDSFPCNTIIRAALTSERDYWIELSIPWLKKIGKNSFVKEINDIQKSMSVSQRVRHLLLKL